MPAVPFAKWLRRITTARGRAERQTYRDRVLARRLLATFERELELADVQGIQFYIQSGIVTLHGTVRHAVDRDLVLSLVRQVPGVKGIVSHLQLAGSGSVTFYDRPNPGGGPAAL